MQTARKYVQSGLVSGMESGFRMTAEAPQLALLLHGLLGVLSLVFDVRPPTGLPA